MVLNVHRNHKAFYGMGTAATVSKQVSKNDA